MKRNVLYAIGILIAAVAAYELFLFLALDRSANYVSIDRCLDNGGCWDEMDKVCRDKEPNAQELCDRTKFDGKTLEKRVIEKIKTH